jgi:putative ABC transport system permease protein
MSLWKIAWRSIEQRGLASLLTMFSMALGVMMVVTVLSIHGVVAESFRNNSSLGYNLIVGAKGGKLQLTLNTVYYLSQPVENIPYDFFLEFLPATARNAEFLASAENDTRDADREGKYSQFTGLAVPLCLGDYLRRFRTVATTPDMFDHLKFGPMADRTYEFSSGRNFQTWSDEHGYFEAVLGATVAHELNLKVGDEISPSHGDPEGEGHAQTFTVVGILQPTGTPNDRAAFVNIEGFYLMEDHSKPLDDASDEVLGPTAPLARAEDASSHPAGHAHEANESLRRDRLPIEQREVTAILLKTVNPFVAFRLPNSIDEGPVAQCVAPIQEITRLFELIVTPIQLALLSMTGLICVVSGISILVSIYNSMSDRRHEIAVMRALGASRGTVMSVILWESILLSLAGGLAGWVTGHGLNWLASGEIERRSGVSVGFFDVAPPLNVEILGLGPIIGWMSPELFLVPALICLAIVVGFLPALAAYRTDVAKSLGA